MPVVFDPARDAAGQAVAPNLPTLRREFEQCVKTLGVMGKILPKARELGAEIGTRHLVKIRDRSALLGIVAPEIGYPRTGALLTVVACQCESGLRHAASNSDPTQSADAAPATMLLQTVRDTMRHDTSARSRNLQSCARTQLYMDRNR